MLVWWIKVMVLVLLGKPSTAFLAKVLLTILTSNQTINPANLVKDTSVLDWDTPRKGPDVNW
jgi:hypothetical protein